MYELATTYMIALTVLLETHGLLAVAPSLMPCWGWCELGFIFLQKNLYFKCISFYAYLKCILLAYYPRNGCRWLGAVFYNLRSKCKRIPWFNLLPWLKNFILIFRSVIATLASTRSSTVQTSCKAITVPAETKLPLGKLVAANNYWQSRDVLTALGIYSSYNGTVCNHHHHHHWSQISSWEIEINWSP